MRYQTALHPETGQVIDISFEIPTRCGPCGLHRGNGIALNRADGNRDFPLKFPWRSSGGSDRLPRMVAGLLCALFGFFCVPGAEPGRAEFERRQREARPLLEEITGRATVVDGDTLEIGGRSIRLQGIDAPESAQTCLDAAGAPWRCGKAATEALDAVAGGKTVVCRQDPRDPSDLYGRVLAMCFRLGEDVQLMLLRAGLAVAYRRYLDYPGGEARPHKAAFIAAEEEARTARRGMWRGEFMPPDQWRAERRNRR